MHSQRGNSSVGRARPCQGRGREFKSRFPLHKDDSQGHPFLLQAWSGGQAGLGCKAGSRFRHQEPSHNRSSTGIRLIFDRSLARPPCPQVPRWHPRVAKGVFRPVFGTATHTTGTSVASSRGEGVIYRVFGTATLPTGASVASSGSHCEFVHRIVALLGFVKFTWDGPLLIIK